MPRPATSVSGATRQGFGRPHRRRPRDGAAFGNGPRRGAQGSACNGGYHRGGRCAQTTRPGRRHRPCQRQPRRSDGTHHRSLLMLYYLYELGEWARKAGYESDFFKALNVFSYITFRSIAPPPPRSCSRSSLEIGRFGDSSPSNSANPFARKRKSTSFSSFTGRRRELPQWEEF